MQHDDRDWLFPERLPSEPPFALAADTRVFRDDGDAMRTAYSTLTVATSETPGTPEAVVLDAQARCLAHPHPDEECPDGDDEGRCRAWIFTAAGLDGLNSERRRPEAA